MVENTAFDKQLIQIGKKMLITTDAWFFAPNGRQYRAAYGTVVAILSSEETLGVKTNAKSTNWYVEIGNMLIAGCQIHYAIQSDVVNTGDVDAFNDDAGKVTAYKHPSIIYNADQ